VAEKARGTVTAMQLLKRKYDHRIPATSETLKRVPEHLKRPQMTELAAKLMAGQKMRLG